MSIIITMGALSLYLSTMYYSEIADTMLGQCIISGVKGYHNIGLAGILWGFNFGDWRFLNKSPNYRIVGNIGECFNLANWRF